MRTLLVKGKFTAILNEKYADRIATIEEIITMTDELGKLMAKHHKEDPFMETALQFALMNMETPGCILLVLEAGHIAQAYLLLRWHLEMTHLCFYLWKNPEMHKEWKNGNEIRPKDIGNFLKSNEYPTWRSEYEEWSNVAHGNHRFISQSHLLSAKRTTSQGSAMMVGQVLVFLMWNSQKMNYIFGQLLKEHIGDEFTDIAARYNQIDDRITKMTNGQKADEANFMGDNHTEGK